MSDRLESVRQKLDRAREHREAFHKLAEEWNHKVFGTWPRAFDADSRIYTLFVNEVPEPDPRLSTILGDCLHNYRSVLDHLAWQLVKHLAIPSGEDPAPDKKILFPIPDKETEWNPYPIRGAMADAKDAIHGLQFNHPQGPGFFVLNKLDNRDKHRTIQLVAHTIAKVGFFNEESLDWAWSIDPGTRIEGGDVIARWKYRADTDGEPDIGPYVVVGMEFVEGLADRNHVRPFLDICDFIVRNAMGALAQYIAP
ncbi:MAG TPA: hypothetical protein VKB70_06090 [Gaiellaceae bacterium]|nr:hypothetical protein [Gaiellaceae bacterium]